MPPEGNEKNEQLLNEEILNKMPGDMKLVLKYPEIDPTTMNSPEEYEKYRANVREMLKDGLSQVKHQKEIKIPFANFDNILVNMKISAVKTSDEYIKTKEVQAKRQLYYSMVRRLEHRRGGITDEAAEKAVGKYLDATVAPFMETAYGEIEKAQQYEDEHYLGVNDIDQGTRVHLNWGGYLTHYDKEKENRRYTMRAKMVLVNGKTVAEHFNELYDWRDIKNFYSSAESYNRAVNTFVGLALQNGYKVEAVIPKKLPSEEYRNDAYFNLSAERVELKADGCKMPEMKFLPERTWEKFCNFFGIQTDRQKHNANVLEYYNNLEKTKTKWAREFGVKRDPEIDRKDYEEAGIEEYEKQRENEKQDEIDEDEWDNMTIY